MNKVYKDIKIGEEAEKLVLDIFKLYGIDCHKVIRSAFYDLKIEAFGLERFIEVKHDIMALKTGNIAIECFNTKQNKPSGITVTKADFWCYVLSDLSIHIATVQNIKTFMDLNKPKRIVENAGDGNAMICLYPKEQVLDNVFHRIDKLNKDEFTIMIDLLCKELTD